MTDTTTGAQAAVLTESAMLQQLVNDMMEQQKGLATDMLTEKQRDRRHKNFRFALIFGGVLLTLFSYMFIYASLGGGVGGSTPSGPYAAIVQLKGPIADSSPANAVTVSKALTLAFEDANAKGVVLYVNSPGGSPVQSSIIYDRIIALKAEYPDKKIITVATDTIASGAYFVAAATDKIFVNRSTIAGSIGVISDGFGFADIMERVGVERRIFTAGNNKALLDSFSPLTESGTNKMSEILGDVHNHFIESVKAGRGERLVLDAEGLFEGDIWTGAQAVNNGLVDGLGDLAGVLEDEFGVEHAKDYTIRPALLDRLTRLAASATIDEMAAHSSLSLR